MFDLEQHIAEWRQRMLAAGIQAPAPLEELESHLREEIARQMEAGLNECEAFRAAERQMGPAGRLKVEFGRGGETLAERFKKFTLSLINVSEPQLAMNNTNSSPEPRWATYTKGATFLLPAAF